jgi:hypothetical protein
MPAGSDPIATGSVGPLSVGTDGTLSSSFTIPANTKFVAVDNNQTGASQVVYASAAYTIAPPTLQVTAVNGNAGNTIAQPGDTVTISGTNYDPAHPPTTLQWCDTSGLNCQAVPITNVQVDANGHFTCTIVVPPPLCQLTNTCSVGGGSGGSGGGQLGKPSPGLYVLPTSGPAGTVVSVGVDYLGASQNVVITAFASSNATGIPLAGALSVTADPCGCLATMFTVPAGTHSIGAVDPSSGTVIAYAVFNAASATTTALAVNPAIGPAHTAVTLTATVTPNAPGTVTYYDAGTAIGSVTSAPFTLTVTAGFAAGSHPFTALFSPTDPVTYAGSTSQVITAVYDPVATGSTDPQSIEVTVPVGTLTISTPYTPTNPFSLGTMVLDSTGSYLQAVAGFPNAGDHLTITDTRAGNQPWTASVAAVDFTSGGKTISAHGLGFTGVTPGYITGNALNATNNMITTTDVPAYVPSDTLYSTTGLAGSPHQFAAAMHGDGTVYVNGSLTLYAPTSTVAGIYTTTLTFTVV